MIATYEPIYDETTINRIAARYDDEIAYLESVGFRKLCIVREMLPPFSIFYFFPIYLMALAHYEPVYIENPFRIATYTPLLVCYETGCIAMLFARGVKYYTHFLDGTTLVSVNFDSETVEKPGEGFYKYSNRVTFEEAHVLHQDRILALVRQDKLLDHNLDYEAYVTMSNDEEKQLWAG